MPLRALLSFALLAILSFGASAQNAKSKTEPLKVGDKAPDFSLSDQNGQTVTLSKAEKPVVLVFYRGYW